MLCAYPLQKRLAIDCGMYYSNEMDCARPVERLDAWADTCRRVAVRWRLTPQVFDQLLPHLYRTWKAD